MIDRCDPEIATWSETGDNFVVKNVEQFASVCFASIMQLETSTIGISNLSLPHFFSSFSECPASILQAFQLF